MIAAERQRLDIAQRRTHFRIARRFVDASRFVFLDESAVQRNMTRLYGRASIGRRCVDHTPHARWKTQTILSAIRLDGVMSRATLVTDGAMDAALFRGWVGRWLAPALRPGDVVVMDNLAAHKVSGVSEAVERVGASVWYLPAYSPDLNPIEQLWSQLKSILRRISARTWQGLTEAIAEALRSVTPETCANYFAACGYGNY